MSYAYTGYQLRQADYHPWQPAYQPPHHPIRVLDQQPPHPQDGRLHQQHHPNQARQPTSWDPPWLRQETAYQHPSSYEPDLYSPPPPSRRPTSWDPPAYWDTPRQPLHEVSAYNQPLPPDPNSSWNQPAPGQPRPATTTVNPMGAMLDRLLEACNRIESRLDATDRRINNLSVDEVYGSLKSVDVAAAFPLNLDTEMLEESKGNDGGDQPIDFGDQYTKYGEEAPNISVEEKSKSATTRQNEKLYAEEEDLLDVEEEDGFLQAFQVANFEYIDEAERADEEEISAPPPEGQASLNKLERASFMVYRVWYRYEVQKVEEFEAMGKGKRSLRQMVSRKSSSKQENLLRVVGHDLIRAEHMIIGHRSVALEADGRFIPPRNNTQCLGSNWRDPIQFNEVHFVLCRFLNSSEILFQLRALIQLEIQGGWRIFDMRMFDINKVTSRKSIECLPASWFPP